MNWRDHVLDKRLRNMDAEIDTRLAECKNQEQWEKIGMYIIEHTEKW
jgi:hypothetical protein